jgi:5-methylcytosine-specific restriction endonuclease McrA
MEQPIRRIKQLLGIPKSKGLEYQRYPIDKETQEAVYADQDGKCYLCTTSTTVPVTHHIKPDGPSDRQNLVMLCATCHFWIHWMLHKHLGWRKVVRFHVN